MLLIEGGGDNFDPAVDGLYEYSKMSFNSFNYRFMRWSYSKDHQPARSSPYSKAQRSEESFDRCCGVYSSESGRL